jgi:hypothetical protein
VSPPSCGRTFGRRCVSTRPPSIPSAWSTCSIRSSTATRFFNLSQSRCRCGSPARRLRTHLRPGRSAPPERRWCAGGINAALNLLGGQGLGKGRLQCIGDELGNGGALKPLVATRGAWGTLAWLSTVAPPLCEYLAEVAGQRRHALAVFRQAAEILTLASGHRITPQALKGRGYRT